MWWFDCKIFFRKVNNSRLGVIIYVINEIKGIKNTKRDNLK